MSFLLDTCLLAEFARPRPAPEVLAWVKEQDEALLFLSVLTLGEIRQGIVRLPDSRRRATLSSWLEKDLLPRFSDRLLPVDQEIALAWGEIQGRALRRGRPLPAVDGLLAATAAVHNLVLVTRNRDDFRETPIRLLDPWTGIR